MPPTTIIAQSLSIATSLVAAGGIATLSLFDIPELQSQPASRSLPSIRWLFSRGSHIFPTASGISAAGFAYLAYAALPARNKAMLQLLRVTTNHWRVNGYLLAAVLCFSIGPFTVNAMVPTNFRLIEMNEQKGGSRSESSARESAGKRSRSAMESVDGKGQANQFRDLSGPQQKTDNETTSEDDREVKDLLAKFGMLNGVRGVLMLAGGVVGLVTALM